jgi:hypothetical protein
MLHPVDDVSAKQQHPHLKGCSMCWVQCVIVARALLYALTNAQTTPRYQQHDVLRHPSSPGCTAQHVCDNSTSVHIGSVHIGSVNRKRLKEPDHQTVVLSAAAAADLLLLCGSANCSTLQAVPVNLNPFLNELTGKTVIAAADLLLLCVFCVISAKR